MDTATLTQTIADIAIDGRGILAADESTGTIGKRFTTINTENNEENRRRYRRLLATTPGLSEYVSGMILFEETLQQKTDEGETIPKALAKQGIVPGIKVDKGLIAFAASPEEQITQGLDGLAERLQEYKQYGARFAKWRAVYNINEQYPSYAAIHGNAQCLARYAAICQSEDIVPIVEPEVLMDGKHSLNHCAKVTEWVLNTVFETLYIHNVSLEHIILKPNMVIPGKDCSDQSNPKAIAEATVRTLKRTVPAAVPTINFLSGGQSSEEASANLNAMNAMGPHPWQLSFSYGRALQEHCLAAWKGQVENINPAQQVLLKRAKLNGAATLGEYSSSME